MTTTDPWIEFATRTIRPTPDVYRRRRLVLLLIVALVLLIAAAIHDGVITDEAPPTYSPDLLAPINTSSDGRYHTCGIVTEHGVTEHLDAYKARCGTTIASAPTPEGR